MTPKQEQFAREYLIDFNATQAAIRAGYSVRSAYSTGERLLRNDEVAKVVSAGRRALAEKAQMSAEDVLVTLSQIARGNLADYITVQGDGSIVYDFSDVTRGEFAALKSITVEEFMDGQGDGARPVKRIKVTLGDKKAAADSLARHYSLFHDKVQVGFDATGLADRIREAKKRFELDDENDRERLHAEVRRELGLPDRNLTDKEKAAIREAVGVKVLVAGSEPKPDDGLDVVRDAVGASVTVFTGVPRDPNDQLPAPVPAPASDPAVGLADRIRQAKAGFGLDDEPPAATRPGNPHFRPKGSRNG